MLEERLTGPEVSLLVFCDGERGVAMPAAQDHKRLGDGDTGPNTGGMGAYAPCPLLDDATRALVMRDIVEVSDKGALGGEREWEKKRQWKRDVAKQKPGEQFQT